MGRTIKGVHAGHRSRLRQRFLTEGIDRFEPHNILELLLFYGIPYQDTNELAHELINRFGSLEAVFEADIAELQTVKGIGENAATLIKLVPQISKYYLTLKTKDKVEFDSMDEVAKYVRDRILFEENEIFVALYFDSAGRLLSFERIAEGTASQINLSITKLVEISVAKNASNVIVAHNHPAGTLSPSTADLHATNHMCDAFKLLRIKFVDHIIVTPDDYYSLANNSVYSRYFDK